MAVKKDDARKEGQEQSSLERFGVRAPKAKTPPRKGTQQTRTKKERNNLPRPEVHVPTSGKDDYTPGPDGYCHCNPCNQFRERIRRESLYRFRRGIHWRDNIRGIELDSDGYIRGERELLAEDEDAILETK